MRHLPTLAAAYSMITAAFLLLGCGGQVRAEITAANARELIPPEAVLLQRTAEGEPVPQIIVADLDGDGPKEAVVCYNRPKAGFAEGWFEVFGTRGGRVRSLVRRRIPWTPTLKRLKKGEKLLRAADLTGDGKPELLLLTSGLNVFTMRDGRIEELMGPWGRTPEDIHDRRQLGLTEVDGYEVRDLDGRGPPELVVEGSKLHHFSYGLDVLAWEGGRFVLANSRHPGPFEEKLAELGDEPVDYFIRAIPRAHMMYHAGRKDEARALLKKHLTKRGEGKPNALLGEFLLLEGRSEEAMERYKGLRSSGSPGWVYAHLALSLGRLGRDEFADHAQALARAFFAIFQARERAETKHLGEAKALAEKINGGWDVEGLRVQEYARPEIEKELAALEKKLRSKEGLGQEIQSRLKGLMERPGDGVANDLFRKLLGELAEAKTREEWKNRSRSGHVYMFFWLLDTNCGVEALIEASRSRHFLVRQMATTVLARTGSEKALPRLEGLLRRPLVSLDKELLAAFADAHPAGSGDKVEAFARGVRKAVIQCLPRFRSEEAVPLLGKRLQAADDDEKRCLLGALGKTKGDAAVPLIEPFLKDEKHRFTALAALKEIGGARAERALLDVLGNRDLREAVAYRLTRIGSDLSVPALATALEETKRSNTRISVIRALGRIGGKAAAEVLLRQLETGKHRREVILALGRTGDERAVRPIRDTLTEFAGVDDRRRVKGKDRDLAACARALGELGSREAVGELNRVLRSGSPPARLEALGALLKLGEKIRASELAAYLEPGKVVPKHIDAMDGNRRDYWIKTRGKDLTVRAAELLMGMGEAHSTRIVFDHLAGHWDDPGSRDLIRKLRALAPEIIPSIMDFLKRRDPAEGDPMTWFLIDLLASVRDKRAVPVLERAYELLPAARRRPGNLGSSSGVQKRLALALKELTGEDYKYLRMIPFD